MSSKRMLMGAAIVSCLTAALAQGAYAQEPNRTNELNARASHGPSVDARSNGSFRESRGARTNAPLNARNGQMERRMAAGDMREGRGYVEQRSLRGERGMYAHARVEGAYRDRVDYRGRTADVTGVDGGYRARRLYAYAPSYDAGYATGPRYAYSPGYSYSPGYDVSVTTTPYYTPGWSVAYADPSYSYGPSVGIGIGPIGIGVGPGWGW